MNAKSMDEFLPGSPRRRLVLDVRRRLATFGVRPMRDPWRTTWEWARNIAMSYSKPSWPMTGEIASMYMVLLLAEMRSLCNGLKLPYRAVHRWTPLPEGVKAVVAAGQLALPAPDTTDL